MILTNTKLTIGNVPDRGQNIVIQETQMLAAHQWKS